MGQFDYMFSHNELQTIKFFNSLKNHQLKEFCKMNNVSQSYEGKTSKDIRRLNLIHHFSKIDRHILGLYIDCI